MRLKEIERRDAYMHEPYAPASVASHEIKPRYKLLTSTFRSLSLSSSIADLNRLHQASLSRVIGYVVGMLELRRSYYPSS